ncbi:MAG TPA: transposase [Candidatus Ozemobacteraceae bacterium]
MRRRSIRLREYDYTWPGAHFITVCTYGQRQLFGKIAGGCMQISPEGEIIQQVWKGLPDLYPNAKSDVFVIMPNHIHGIILLDAPLVSVGAGLKPAPTSADEKSSRRSRHGLPEIVRALKSFSAWRINEYRKALGTPVWQRGYYEHVIRNDESIDQIRVYIMNNPARWYQDKANRQFRCGHSGVSEEAMPWDA